MIVFKARGIPSYGLFVASDLLKCGKQELPNCRIDPKNLGL